MKVVAIDHNTYLYPHFEHPHLIRNQKVMHNIEFLRHDAYPRAHAVVALSPVDALIWKHLGAKARFIPNPATF